MPQEGRGPLGEQVAGSGFWPGRLPSLPWPVVSQSGWQKYSVTLLWLQNTTKHCFPPGFSWPLQEEVLMWLRQRGLQPGAVGLNLSSNSLVTWLFSQLCTADVGVLSCFSHVWLFVTPWTVAHPFPLSMGFSRQEYWSGLPCVPQGDLLHPGVEHASLRSPALACGFFTATPHRKPQGQW